MSIISATILLFLVMDAFGNVPFFISVLNAVEPKKRQKILVLELFIALFVLILFLFTGSYLLKILHISESSLRIAGSIILFLISIQMVFGKLDNMLQSSFDSEPFVVPLAIPSLAGPSSISTIILLTGREPNRLYDWLFALLIAWILTSIVLLLSAKLHKILGKKGISALQHLMGLVLTALAVEMFIDGLRVAFSL